MKKSVVAVAILLSANLTLLVPAQATSNHNTAQTTEKHKDKAAQKKDLAEKKAAREQAKKEREAENKQKKAERAAKLAEPRVRFRMNSAETAFRGVSVSAELSVYNAPLGPFGSASAELEILDANDNTLALEECTTAPGLPTRIENDTYRISCKISEKGDFSSSLVVLDLPFGTYSGSGRYPTSTDGTQRFPVGLGLISLEEVAPAQATLDCQYSDWSAWETCNFFGNQTRTRSILEEAQPGGLVCDNNLLFEIRGC